MDGFWRGGILPEASRSVCVGGGGGVVYQPLRASDFSAAQYTREQREVQQICMYVLVYVCMCHSVCVCVEGGGGGDVVLVVDHLQTL